MFQILGLIFFIIFFIVIIGFFILYKIIKTVSGIGKSSRKRSEQFDNYRNSDHTEYKKTNEPKSKNKVFDDNEGEYIDFEEIKD